MTNLRISYAIFVVNVTGNTLPTDIKAVSPPLRLWSISRLTATRDATQQARFGLHRTNGIGAASSCGCTLEAGQHALADRPVMDKLRRFICHTACVWWRRKRFW